MQNVEKGKAKKILIVEDDLNTMEVIYETLALEGYDIRKTENGKLAMDVIETWHPHLVLTDHDMPELNGLEMLRSLRAKDNYVTVLFISGRKDLNMIVSALNEGADDFIRKPFSCEELSARIRASLRNNDTHRKLQEINFKLQEMVDIDDLTGLFNMRSIYEKIDNELLRAKRYERKVACVMLDMDNFKSVNDENDHLFGSFVLKQVGRIIKEGIREVDFAARYGGDEFLICLTETDEAGAMSFCERLRNTIKNYEFNDGKNHIKLTCSMGLAVVAGNELVDARNLVRRADHSLYEAKEGGRDLVCLHGSKSHKVIKVG